MEKAREFFKLSQEESESVLRINVHPHQPMIESSFYEDFTSTGLRVDQIEPGFISCSFIVPPRLLDRNGNWANGAIASLVDFVSWHAIPAEGGGLNVSVNMSISYLSTVKLNDEIEINARVLGQKGRYFRTHILLRNKITQEIIAEARQSLFNAILSKM